MLCRNDKRVAIFGLLEEVDEEPEELLLRAVLGFTVLLTPLPLEKNAESLLCLPANSEKYEEDKEGGAKAGSGERSSSAATGQWSEPCSSCSTADSLKSERRPAVSRMKSILCP